MVRLKSNILELVGGGGGPVALVSIMLNICENITITAFSCCKCTAEEVFRKNVDMDQHSFYAVSGSAFFLSRIPIQILGTLTHVCIKSL